ncbi:hypothetical protein BJ878DRAFT_497358 [Calycina marina]|uniref:tryptophan--tRNA ligase n=1 Tax=Calycina marina TaxID=1763456 RepID=A0A9P7Z7F7_9HELO|nr:hypothetical protein BJ878DRAFT_497358 [Calycina marina]
MSLPRHRLLSPHPLKNVLPKSSCLPISFRRLNSASPQTHENQVIFSGIQPTGVPHIGNYLGALQQWVNLQSTARPSTKLLFSIVDWHAITKAQDPALLARRSRETLATLLAVGIDPERSVVFLQSSVPQHLELYWQLLCTATTWGGLSRMTSWKSKIGIPADSDPLDPISGKPPMGLFNYPVLQAADILIHRATHVPVGDDQSQHLELTRQLTTSFNHIYATTFTPPQTLLSPAKRIMSLTTPLSKMSKSDHNPLSRILITSPPAAITLALKAALTDSLNTITYSPLERPGVSNLLDLYSYFDPQQRTPAALAASCRGMGLGALKALVAEAVVEGLAPVRETYERVVGEDESSGGAFLRGVRERGGRRARDSAEETMVGVRRAMGFWR